MSYMTTPTLIPTCYSADILLKSLEVECGRRVVDNATHLELAASVQKAKLQVKAHCPGKHHVKLDSMLFPHSSMISVALIQSNGMIQLCLHLTKN